jgi:hypothetical protein
LVLSALIAGIHPRLYFEDSNISQDAKNLKNPGHGPGIKVFTQIAT